MKMLLGGIAMTLLMASVAEAALKTERIEYRQGDTPLVGYLAYDDSLKGKRPGVLLVHEWWGLNDYIKGRAEQLARLGYVALAIDMYGRGQVTTDSKEAGKLATAIKNNNALGRARAVAGLEQLRQRPEVDRGRLAAIGYCFGGTVALELARSGADLRGVASFHGGLATPTPASPGQIKAKVLVLHGADDTFESAAELAAFQEEMRRAKADWQMNIYGGARHSFTNPASDKAGMKGVAYNAAADRRSFQALLDLFNEIFNPPVSPER